MSKSIEIKIAVVVGDNGKFAADAFRGEETDWEFMSDSVGIYDGNTKDITYPTSEKQYIVTTWVELPEISEVHTVSVEEIKS